MTFNKADADVREQYHKNRQTKPGQLENCPEYLIPQTGLKLFKIDKGKDENLDLFDVSNNKFGRGSIQEILDLGYAIDGTPFTFKNEKEFREMFERYRFGEPLSDTEFDKFKYMYNRTWVKIYPQETTPTEFNTRLVML